MKKLLAVILLMLVLLLATTATALASPWTATGNTCDPKGPATSGYLALNTFSWNALCFAGGTGPVR